MTINQDNSQKIQHLRSLLQDINCGFLTTIQDDGSLRSRPMHTCDLEADGTLWFFTLTTSHKVTEIEHHHQVSIDFCSSKQQRYLSISGTANMIKEQHKLAEKWHPELEIWFPQGLATPDLSLLKVEINQADFWESSDSFIPQKIISSADRDYSLR
jgi:general stress protein 26